MENENEFSDLIDVSDVPPIMEEEESSPKQIIEEKSPSPSEFSISPLGDRLAALLIDGLFLSALYTAVVLVFSYVQMEAPPFYISLQSTSAQILFASLAGATLIYFIIFEGLFYTTLGKSLCHLTLRKSDGRQIGILGSLLRNLFKPIDLVLFPISLIVLEKSSWHQRLGDFVGQTVVIKRAKFSKKQYSPNAANIASASGRCYAFLIDFILVGAFVAGILLLLDNTKPYVSLALVSFLPIVVFFGLAAFEALFGTSPGKWIFGYIICYEDGTKLGWSGAVIRTICRTFDTNFLGVLCLFAGSRHQRPGDLAAGTLVLRYRRELRGFLCLILGIAISLMFVYVGAVNPDSIIKEGLSPNFMLQFTVGRPPAANLPKRLTINELKYSIGDPPALKDSPYFKGGDKITISFLVNGYTAFNDTPWLSEDLTIRYPDGTVALQLENLVEFKSPLPQDGSVEMKNNFDLPPNAPAGRYTMVLTVHDKHVDKTLKRHYFFYVTANAVEATSPPQPADNINEEAVPAARE